MPTRRVVANLFVASALSLFVELTFVRWMASELRVIAFYKNLALIAAFLGLGLGFAALRRAASERWFERWYFPILTLCVVAVLALSRVPLAEGILLNRLNAQEYVWAGYANIQDRLTLIILTGGFYGVLFGLFLLIVFLFIPLGRLTAGLFQAFDPLPGYTVNVLGSLAGVGLYVLISFLGWPPFTWFLLAGLAALYFLPRENPRALAWQGALALLPVALTLLWPTGAERTLWSPYYRIDINGKYLAGEPRLQVGYDLSINQAWHQSLWNLAPDFILANHARAPELFDGITTQYDSPYRAARQLDRVLVVGAGTGNDVAAALRAGAGQVVAVEIDPRIFELGQALHPEQPYADSRVQRVNEDARAFFHNDSGRYDLIVFGLLDSHTLFGTASSIRLDNFVYTQESLGEARQLLAPGGVLALSFGVPRENEWVGLRLYRNLTDVFGHAPAVYQFRSGDIMFLIDSQGGLPALAGSATLTPRPDYSYHADIAAATDDWPYLYLRQRTIPVNYLVMFVGVALVSLVLIRRTLPDFRQLDWHFFFMGAAFFLLETKSVTEMALLLGSTWVVNAAVIAAILFMIVIANAVVIRFQLTNWRVFYLGLAATLALNFIVSVNNLLGLPPALRVVVASGLLALPLLFAAVIFAITFSRARAVDIALGSNLIGSVLGGLSEYASLALGIRSLYGLALAFYLVSAVAFWRSTRQ